ncbi:MAG: ATP-binding protein [Actinomycetota bacterium]
MTPEDENGETRAFRVVVTGGPGAGKTTAADLFRREIGDRVVVVPESATLLYSGGFPRPEEPDAIRSTQRAIYHLQRNLEDVQSARFPDRLLVCDRGTVDSGAYWPDGAEDFFGRVGSSHDRELARYDAVLFFETAARGGLGFDSENRFRTETATEAVELDSRLRELWGSHPRFVPVAHTTSFMDKMVTSIELLRTVLAESNRPRSSAGSGQSKAAR